MIPVIVCTDKRGVMFGYAKKAKPNKRKQIKLKNARMCLFWPASVGGVFGLSDIGPNHETKISATSKKALFEGVTAILHVTNCAEKAWKSAPIEGRK